MEIIETNISPERQKEIDRELSILDSWSCSQHIKDIVRDMRHWIDNLKEEKLYAIDEEWKHINMWKPYLHHCKDWDGLLIDRVDLEFEHCSCFKIHWTKPRAKG